MRFLTLVAALLMAFALVSIVGAGVSSAATAIEYAL
jgi:hypothetical protein